MKKRELTFISGLFFNNKNGKILYSKEIISEVKQSLEINTWYKDNLVCYADTKETANILSKQGLYVHKIFDDAPKDIKENAVHKMKHWIMLNASKEFGDVVWLDWDTYSIKPIDDIFIKKCIETKFPKFTFIPNYWATVNCAVYYMNDSYCSLMEKSFKSIVPEPNDELLWLSVLPQNITSQPEYWLDDYVINIWDEVDFELITNNTYFLHIRNFEMLKNRFM